MGYKLLIFLVLCFSSMDSCDDKLTLTKEPYTGSQMKIEGYYYRKNAIYCTSVYFLYRDGTFIDAGCFSCKPDEIENHVKNKDWTQWRRYEKSAIGYGVFQISGSQILIENWRPSSSWSLPAYLYKGEILNDTTFVITQSQRSKPNALDNDFSAKHEIYRFRHFSSKPDSTNRFTK